MGNHLRLLQRPLGIKRPLIHRHPGASPFDNPAEKNLYLTSLRAQAREAAADLYYMTQLRKGAPEPPREPNVDADRALALLLARPTAYPDLPHLNAKMLEELDEESLNNVILWLERRAANGKT